MNILCFWRSILELFCPNCNTFLFVFFVCLFLPLLLLPGEHNRKQNSWKRWQRWALTPHSPACSKVCGPAESRSSGARPRTPRSAHTPRARGSRWLWAGICLRSAGGIRRTLASDPYLQGWERLEWSHIIVFRSAARKHHFSCAQVRLKRPGFTSLSNFGQFLLMKRNFIQDLFTFLLPC